MAQKDTYKILDNKERWKLAMEINNIGFYDWYPLENKIYWDKNLHRMNGLSPGSKADRLEHFLSIVHPEDKEQVSQNMVEVIDPNSDADKFDHHFRSILQGKIRYMRSSGIRTRDKSGNIREVFGMVVDNTSKVETEKKIWENEERLKIATQATGIGIFDWHIEDDRLYWDNRMYEMFGLKLNSKVNRNEHFFKCLHPDDRERVSENYRRRISNKTNETRIDDEFRIVIKNQVRFIKSYGTIFRDPVNRVFRITGTLLDITSLKKAQKELSESQEYFRSVFEGNSDTIFTIDRKKHVVFINHVPAGLTKKDVIGRPLLDLVVPQDRKMISGIINDVLKHGKNGQFESILETTEGINNYSVRVSPLMEKKTIFGATFIARDITREKDSQEKLRRQALELQITNKNLEQFAYVSSHDIKAPITNLESLVNLLDHPGMINEEGQPIFKRIKATIRQMNQTIHSLNEVFSVQSNLNLPKENLYLEKILRTTMQNINNQIEKSGARISFNFKDAPKIKFPKAHLLSIFQNLISNSIKYKQPDKQLRIKISSKKVRTSSRIQLVFEDNGRGMDLNSYGSKVFGLFQRFHLDTDGKGMGLYIIKMILENYGGEISLKSTQDRGTKFIIIV